MATVTVCLVTPADCTGVPGKINSSDILNDELKRLLAAQAAAPTLKYHCCSAVGSDLPTQAAAAKGYSPNVIVAAGTKAAIAVQKAVTGNDIPIVMIGGEAPPTITRNLTGFLLEATPIAKSHAQNLVKAGAQSITVLYDPSNSASQDAYTNGVVPNIPAKNLNPPLNASTKGDIQGLALPAGTDGFMVIPNATYYEYCNLIANLVDGNVATIYYPEREFKRKHTKSTIGVNVLGHSVPLTYRQAAWLIDSIVSGDVVINNNWPALAEGIQDST
jgi:hypothetical protein